MCNGDFGMYRVMPWAYPTIPGQSSGGASVDPIPKPELPYNFDGVSVNVPSATATNVVMSFYNNELRYSMPLFFNVSGIVINDITNVSGLRTLIVQNNLTVTPTSFNANGGTYTKTSDVQIAFFSASKSDPNKQYGFLTTCTPSVSGNYEYNPKVNVTYSGSLIFKFVVIDSNGETMQESENITVVVP